MQFPGLRHAGGRGRPRGIGQVDVRATAAVDGMVCLDSLHREIGGDFSVKFSVLSRGVSRHPLAKRRCAGGVEGC